MDGRFGHRLADASRNRHPHTAAKHEPVPPRRCQTSAPSTEPRPSPRGTGHGAEAARRAPCASPSAKPALRDKGPHGPQRPRPPTPGGPPRSTTLVDHRSKLRLLARPTPSPGTAHVWAAFRVALAPGSGQRSPGDTPLAPRPTPRLLPSRRQARRGVGRRRPGEDGLVDAKRRGACRRAPSDGGGGRPAEGRKERGGEAVQLEAQELQHLQGPCVRLGATCQQQPRADPRLLNAPTTAHVLGERFGQGVQRIPTMSTRSTKIRARSRGVGAKLGVRPQNARVQAEVGSRLHPRARNAAPSHKTALMALALVQFRALSGQIRPHSWATPLLRSATFLIARGPSVQARRACPHFLFLEPSIALHLS